MNVRQWNEIKDFFNQAVALETVERDNFLNSIKDVETRREVEKLLVSDAEFTTFAPLFGGAPEIEHPETIGKYRIERELGRGGMGVVYLATHTDLKKQVALKIIKRGMDSDEIVRRFLKEREILAALEHQNVARLLDGGTTDDGTPFLVMEYVDGEDLPIYCEKNNLSPKERIELFRKICAAVSYAHSRLVVHRDLKPSNILITNDGEPKLLDFGISKLLATNSIAETGTATKFGMMTPKYASPEQFKGETVSTATDVYSLGVILFELLTGNLPFDFENRRVDEIARLIFETEPRLPSSASSSRNKIKFSPPRKPHLWQQTDGSLDSQPKTNSLKFLRGDLDNIILKALRKEIAKRYLSVENLSEDLRRYLAGLPVTAHADTLTYRAAKFVRRNRALVGATAAVMLTLLGGAAATGWQASVAQTERHKAEQRFEQVRALANNVIFKYHDEIETLPGSTKVRAMIVADALGYLDELARDAGNNRNLQIEIARAYLKIAEIQKNRSSSNLGDSDSAVMSLDKSLTIQKILAADPAPGADLLLLLSQTYIARGDLRTDDADGEKSRMNDYLAAQAVLQQAVTVQNPATKARTYDSLARLQYKLASWQGENVQISLDYLQAALENASRALDAEPDNISFQKRIADIHGLTGCFLGHPGYTNLQNYDAAILEIRQGLEIERRLLAADPDNTALRHSYAITATAMGEIFLEKDTPAEALKILEEAYNIREDLLRRDSYDATAQNAFAIAAKSIGTALIAAGKTDAGIARLRQAVKLFESFGGARMTEMSNQHTYAVCLERLADGLRTQKNFAEAAQKYRAALQIHKQVSIQQPTNVELISYVAALKIKAGSMQLKLTGEPSAREMVRDGVRQLAELERQSPLRQLFVPAYNLGKQETSGQISE